MSNLSIRHWEKGKKQAKIKFSIKIKDNSTIETARLPTERVTQAERLLEMAEAEAGANPAKPWPHWKWIMKFGKSADALDPLDWGGPRDSYGTSAGRVVLGQELQEDESLRLFLFFMLFLPQ